jgi:hypothetical protein
MGFLHPAIAWAGVASVALPIIIHLLFRRRRVAIEWAAMELLREAVRRTNRRLRFEQWIVLALRCLALLAAGLAIAVPVLDGGAAAGDVRRLVIVVVDDGPTSALRVGEESELARMVDEVRRMLIDDATRAGTSRDRVGVVRAAGVPSLALAPTSDAGAIEQALARIEVSEMPSALAEAVALAQATIDAEKAAGRATGELPRIVVASAFRRASVAEGTVLAGAMPAAADAPTDATTRGVASRTEVVALVPAQDVPGDVRVARVDARPAPAGDAVIVRASVVREGPSLEAAQTFVRAAAEGMSQPPARAVMWEKGQAEATVDFQLVPAGLAEGVRRIGVTVTLDDDRLAIGNAAFAAVDVRRELEIGVVGRRVSLDASDLERVPASLWVSRALSPGVGSGMRVRDIDPAACDARALLGLDAVVLARPDLVSPDACEALGGFVRAGGVAVVLPTGESTAQSWGQAVFSRLSVPVRVSAEAVERDPPLRLAEEQVPSNLLASIGPELAALAAPIESRRLVECSGFARGEIVLANADGSPLVLAQAPRGDDGRTARGLVIVFASAPELTWTNLPVKPLMVPLFQELVRAGIQLAAGRNEVLVGERMAGEPNALMQDARGGTLALAADGRSAEAVSRAGLWRSDAGAVVAANVRGASLALAPTAVDAVRAFLAPVGDVRVREIDAAERVAEVRGAADWSFALLVAALVLLLVEGVLARVFSHASVRRAQPVEAAVAIVGRVRARTQPVATGGRP